MTNDLTTDDDRATWLGIAAHIADGRIAEANALVKALDAEQRRRLWIAGIDITVGYGRILAAAEQGADLDLGAWLRRQASILTTLDEPDHGAPQ